MDKLFSQAFLKIKRTMGLPINTQLKVDAIRKQIFDQYQMGFAIKEFVRIPDNEIRTLLKIPCPVKKPEREIIGSLKLLRQTYSITEKNVCKKCPHYKECPFRKKTLENVGSKAGLEHLISFFYLL